MRLLTVQRYAGFLLLLSGGIYSCATAVLVFSTMRMVHKSIQEGNQTVLNDCRRTAGPYEKKDWVPSSP
jgi:NAD+ synthase (glutamine-hydrolysing)